jgi:hypothetical protein
VEPLRLVPSVLIGIAIGLPLPTAAAILCLRRRAGRGTMILALVLASVLNLALSLGIYFSTRPEGGANQHSSMREYGNFLMCAGLGLTQLTAFAAILVCAGRFQRRESRPAESE